MGDAEIVSMDKFRKKRKDREAAAERSLPIEVQADRLLAILHDALGDPQP